MGDDLPSPRTLMVLIVTATIILAAAVGLILPILAAPQIR